MLSNLTVLIGNLGADPELRQSKSGKDVCNLSLAVDRRYTRTGDDGQSETVKTTDWFNVSVWGNQAKTCATWLRKGSQVGVRGYIRPRTYTDANGVDHRTVDIRADEVQFLNNIRSSSEVHSQGISTTVAEASA